MTQTRVIINFQEEARFLHDWTKSLTEENKVLSHDLYKIRAELLLKNIENKTLKEEIKELIAENLSMKEELERKRRKNNELSSESQKRAKLREQGMLDELSEKTAEATGKASLLNEIKENLNSTCNALENINLGLEDIGQSSKKVKTQSETLEKKVQKGRLKNPLN